MKSKYDTPLTYEEAVFAEENHYLVEKYLRIRRLPVDEWYDVVIFRFLLSVKRWFALPELHKHNFEIIAFYAMRSAIGHEYEKQNRRVKTISLNAVIPGTENIEYMDVLADPKDHFERVCE